MFFAFGVGRLVYALFMMLSRKKAVNHLVSAEEQWLQDQKSEKSELQNKLEGLKWKLLAAKGKRP